MRVHSNTILPDLLPVGQVIIDIKHVSFLVYIKPEMPVSSSGCEKHGSLRTNTDFTLY